MSNYGKLSYGGQRTGNNYGRKSYGNGSGPRHYEKPKYQPKHSGCKVRKDFRASNGKTYGLIITGWKYTKKFGMTSFVAVLAKSGHVSPAGNASMVVKFTSQISQSTVWGSWNPHKQMLTIMDFGII